MTLPHCKTGVVAALGLLCTLECTAAPFAHVRNEGTARISVIDTTTDQVTRTLRDGQIPRGIAFLPDGSRAYVAAEHAHLVNVIDTKTSRKIAGLSVDELPWSTSIG